MLGTAVQKGPPCRPEPANKRKAALGAVLSLVLGFQKTSGRFLDGILCRDRANIATLGRQIEPVSCTANGATREVTRFGYPDSSPKYGRRYITRSGCDGPPGSRFWVGKPVVESADWSA